VAFAGQIANFGGQNGIDFRDIAFGANTSLGYAENDSNTSGTLGLSDGAHWANITLLGDYMAASFATGSDGHGGTLVTYSPPNESSEQMAAHASWLIATHGLL
jgi:hypothetical protein